MCAKCNVSPLLCYFITKPYKMTRGELMVARLVQYAGLDYLGKAVVHAFVGT